ncbi:MAG: FtsW/RodA/SpoVE family cell cycle protein, partial [Muribaculaceae bacterium]|nr:FtsW/RodA/SpoVE family cell cycle protein [Muribaculaceae bacterium]
MQDPFTFTPPHPVDDRPEESAAAPQPKAEPLPGQQDKYFWAIYLMLVVISVIELYSASSREVVAGNVYLPIIRHAVMLGAGFVIILILSRIPYQKLIKFIPIFVVGSIVMMIYVLIAGDIINGARRSFSFAGINIQPSEFLKLSAVLIIALVMSRTQLGKNEETRTRGVKIVAAMVLIMGGLLFTQGLTNTILLMAISFSMMIVGGIQLKKLGAVLIVYVLVAGAAYLVKEHNADVRVGRQTTWVERMKRFTDKSVPKYEQPIDANNRQEMYAYMAQANGGIFGVMPGNSRETSRLPLAFSDYIFSIVVEDLGLLGGLLLLAIYLSLLAHAGHVASQCRRAFPAMLVIGCALM